MLLTHPRQSLLNPQPPTRATIRLQTAHVRKHAPTLGDAGTVSHNRAALTFSQGRTDIKGATLHPGDSWTISVTNAAPNAPVEVAGIYPDGHTAAATMGQTDAGGNWSITGTIDAGSIGNWDETWSVGGTIIGRFVFTVAAAATAAAPPPTQTAAAPPPISAPPAASSPSNGSSSSSSAAPAATCASGDIQIFGFCLPWWGLTGAAIAALFMLGGRR